MVRGSTFTAGVPVTSSARTSIAKRGGCECTVGELRGKNSLLTSANTFDGGDGKRWGVEGVVVVDQVAGRQIKSCIGL